jgi:GDPmannose 4,6-dehydratase
MYLLPFYSNSHKIYIVLNINNYLGKLYKMNKQKVALITGITGQDGSYLSEFLLDQGYEVHGIIRRTSTFNTDRIDHIYIDPHSPDAKLFLHYGDLTDGTTLRRILEEVKPREIYNLGAQSHVRVSFDSPEYTVDSVAMGALRILEAVRDYQQRTGIEVRFYQAGSSEMFGKVIEVPQTETTPFYPRSPYSCAKVYAHWQTINYRESYDLFACNGILFNHESPRRGETFVTRKITRAVARIVEGTQKKLYLGNLDSKRDWGYAKDYVRAMWLMLQQDQPDDYVVATGETYEIKEFLDIAFGHVNLDWHNYVAFDPRYLRPAEVDLLIGDPTKAKEKLGWSPSVTFEELVKLMVNADLINLNLPTPDGSKGIDSTLNRRNFASIVD